MIGNSETWTERAECRGRWQDWDGDGTAQQIAEAKAVCLDCPVIMQCATYALKERPLLGVWAAQNVPDNTKPDARRKAFVRMEGLLQAAGLPVPQRRREQFNITHGTSAGYRMHYRRGEKACDTCQKAEMLRLAERRIAS